jgi:hypothetical protein
MADIDISVVPRRFRLPHHGIVRPAFSWRGERPLLDLSQLHFLLFLLFWVLFWCWWTYLVTTSSYSSNLGMEVKLDRYLGRDAVQIIEGQVWAVPLIANCEEIWRRSEVKLGLVCVLVLPGGELRVNDRYLGGAELLEPVIVEQLATHHPIRMLIQPLPECDFRDFMFVLDEGTRVLEAAGVSADAIKIAPSRPPVWPLSPKKPTGDAGFPRP